MPSSGNAATATRSTAGIIALCFSALVLEGYDLFMFGTIAPSLLTYAPWGLTPATVGLIGSAMAVGMLVGAVLAAGLTDRLGRRSVLIASVATFSVAMAAAALAPNPVLLGLFRIVVGLGAGAVMPTAVALLVEFSPAGRRTRTSALGFIGVCVGGVLAGGLSILVIPTLGFRWMFALGAVPALVVVPVLLRKLPESPAFLASRGRITEAEAVAARYGVPTESPATEQGRRRGLAGLVGDGRTAATLLFWVSMFFCQMSLFLVSAWLPQIMAAAGYGATSALALLLTLNAGTIVGILLAAPLADRFGPKLLTVVAFLVAAVAMALMFALPPLWTVYLLAAAMGFGTLGTQVLLNTFIATWYPPESRAAGVGMALGIGRFGAILGPTYGGLVVGSGLAIGWQFLAFAVPAAVGALAALAVRDRQRARLPQAQLVAD